MKVSILFICFWILFFSNIKAQDSCRINLQEINRLSNLSYHILKDESINIHKRIRKSKKNLKTALEIGYETIKNYDCQEYTAITEQMIDIESRLGNHSKSIDLAHSRIHKLYPNWKDLNVQTKIYPSYFEKLAQQTMFAPSNNYYKYVKKNKGAVSVCGTTTTYEDFFRVYNNSKTLFLNYGPIYCIRYLQNLPLHLNIKDQTIKPVSEKINDLIIQSLLNYYDVNELKNEFFINEIKRLPKSDFSLFHFYGYTGRYYFEMKGCRIHLNLSEKEYKRLANDAKEQEKIKLDSQFYQSLKIYLKKNN